MSTILAYTSPARGHLYPMMDVLLELQRRGHRVVIQTLADAAETVKGCGMDHRQISPAIEAIELHDFAGGNPMKQIQIAVDTWLKRAPQEVEDLEAAISEVEPDFLLIDANTYGAAAFAEASGLPWALHQPYCLPIASPDAPAFGPGFPPPASVFSRLRDTVVRTVFHRATRRHASRLDTMRRRVGASGVSTLFDVFEHPPRILYRTAEPFEYPRSDWPENVVPIGPGLWAPPGDTPEWLTDMPQPRVLVTISTEAQEDGDIIRTAIESLRDFDGSVICTTAAANPADFEAPEDHIRLEKFLPHAEVFPYIDCVVTHGGMGTVQRALSAAVPLVVVPWGRDQNETAQRTVECNAGVRLNPAKLSADRLRDCVQRAMTMTAGARRVADEFAAAGGATKGAETVEAEIVRPERESMVS